MPCVCYTQHAVWQLAAQTPITTREPTTAAPAVVLPQPGDAVVLNAPNSTVGRAVLQLCRLLRLRAVAVLRGAATGTAVGSSTGDARYEATAARLRELGATLVLRDEGCLKVSPLPPNPG